MRRITIWATEDAAREVTKFLEREGLDFMSEDYAPPVVQRRDVPARRQPPERSDVPPPSLLRRRPSAVKRKPGRQEGDVAKFIVDVLTQGGFATPKELINICMDKGYRSKRVRDTLRRMLARDRVIWTPQGNLAVGKGD
jgi:hypothetical protein